MATCESEFDLQALTVEQAQERIDAAILPVWGNERLAIRDCLGRILSEDVLASRDIPAASNSAMDGYALRTADLDPAGHTSMEVIGDSFAGKPYRGRIEKGQCVRIMTGALLPDGADAVVMQEHVSVEDGTITIWVSVRTGLNVRFPGEDLKGGTCALTRGKRLNAADIGLLAAMGYAEADVRRKPAVAFFSTGDELTSIGRELAAGQIYDSNRYTLHALLTRADVRLVDLGIVRDDLNSVSEALEIASHSADLILTSGGVSVGEADYVKRALADKGEIGFWKIAVKPGRPLAFGKVGNTPIFGLPGNPVSVMTTFILFVRRAISRLNGELPSSPRALKARCAENLRKTPGRADYQRGLLSETAEGLVAKTTGLQGSHVLSSMSKANCFIVLPRDYSDVPAGTEVDVIPFDGLL